MRDDYAPFFAFARASGLRLAECLLRWSRGRLDSAADQEAGQRRRPVVTPITSEIRALLWPLRGHHPEFVFTFVRAPARPGARPPLRSPMAECRATGDGCASVPAWSVLRFHDLRHDFATKLLRETGNLRLVQKALGHRDIKTTTRYAHVLDSDVAEAMERPAKSRKNSRTRLKVV